MSKEQSPSSDNSILEIAALRSPRHGHSALTDMIDGNFYVPPDVAEMRRIKEEARFARAERDTRRAQKAERTPQE